MELKKQIGVKLREAFERSGLKMTELSERTHISRESLNNYFSGTQNITIDYLEKICGELGLDVADVVPSERSRGMKAFQDGLSKARYVFELLGKIDPQFYDALIAVLEGMTTQPAPLSKGRTTPR